MGRKIVVLALAVMMILAEDSALSDSQKADLDKRKETPQETFSRLSALYAHEAIYILPYYHSFSPTYDNNVATETKFQFSFRIPMFSIGEHNKFFFAYTQTAFFQNYNDLDSKPFRDTDYAPELYWSYEGINDIVRWVQLGYKHISNGERALRSRTQNQIMLKVRLQYDTSWGLKIGTIARTWIWMSLHYDGYLHDNSDLARYRGYADLFLYLKYNNHLLEFKASPIVSDIGFWKPHFEVGYTYRLTKNLGIYAQYSNGYGDNIYEYNIHSNRLGIGLRLWQGVFDGF